MTGIDADSVRIATNAQLELYNEFRRETGIPCGTNGEIGYLPESPEFWFIYPKRSDDSIGDNFIYLTVDEYMDKDFHLVSDRENWGYMGASGTWEIARTKRTYQCNFSTEWLQRFSEVGINVVAVQRVF